MKKMTIVQSVLFSVSDIEQTDDNALITVSLPFAIFQIHFTNYDDNRDKNHRFKCG